MKTLIKENNLKLNITKITNIILYMLKRKTMHLNDKKLSIMLFLIDYKHMEKYNKKIFGESYIKGSRNPEPIKLKELFDTIANNEDLDENNEKLFLIQEFLDTLDIEILNKENFIELKFIKMEEEYDSEIFSKDELKTISKIVEKYKNDTARKLANTCFSISKVRETLKGEVII
jgi:hypothetical protein